MSKRRPLLSLLAIGATALVLIACGSDDENPSDPGNPDAGDPDVVNPGDDGGGGDADAGGPLTFPQYVEQSILTKTNDTAAPDPESAWGALQDNESYVVPAGFF